MKKVKHLVLLIAVLLFPIIVNAEGNVSITKIVKKDVTGYAYEVNPPTFKGLDVSYDLSFHQVGDSVTYIATVQNSDKEAYKIENKNSFSPSGYMTYEFSFTDNTNTIKANETKDMVITIKYNKEVPTDKLVNGEYKEQNQMNLVLVNSNGNILNPNTASTIYYIIGILSLLIISLLLFKKHKKASIFLLTLSLLLPITTYALKEITITLNTQVIIEKDLKFCIYENVMPSEMDDDLIEPPKTYYKYTEGDTFRTWFNNNPEFVNNYFGTDEYLDEFYAMFIKKELFTCGQNVLDKYGLKVSDFLVRQIPSEELEPTHLLDHTQLKVISPSYGLASGGYHTVIPEEAYNELDYCSRNYEEKVNISSKIKRSSEGCYSFPVMATALLGPEG